MGCAGDSRRIFVRLPIVTSQLTFVCAAPARPLTDFETKQLKAELTTDELLYNVHVVALDSEGAEVIELEAAGDPKVGQGTMLKLEGLVALPWSMGERSGVSCGASADGRPEVLEGHGATALEVLGPSLPPPRDSRLGHGPSRGALTSVDFAAKRDQSVSLPRGCERAKTKTPAPAQDELRNR
jgi:hypothetical protein